MKTLRLLPILFLCATAWPQAFGPIFGPNIPNNATSFVLTNILNGTNAAGILNNLSAPRYVSTLADLATCGTNGPSVAVTLGHTTAGDGGGSQYTRVAASTYATNELVLNGVGCQWAEKDWLESRTFNVRRMGAVADGVTDCTTSISNALRLANIYGGTVYFPKGKYRQASSLNFMSMTNQVGFRIIGDGPENTWIYGDFPNLVTISGEYARLWRWKDGASTGPVRGPWINGMRFSGNTEWGSTNLPHRLLSFSRAGDQVGLTIENCQFSHSANGALELSGTNLRDTILRQIYIHDDQTNAAIATEGSGSIGWGGTGLYATDITTTNVACDPVDANGMHALYWTGVDVSLNNWTTYGRFADGPGRVSNAHIKNVKVYNAYDSGLLFSTPSSNVVVQGAYLENSPLKLGGTVGSEFRDIIVRWATNTVPGLYTNTYIINASGVTSHEVRFAGLDIESNGGLLGIFSGTTNFVIENSRIRLPYSTRALSAIKNVNLTLRGNRIEILGGNQEFFFGSSSTTDNNDNILSDDNTYVWKSNQSMNPFELRNPALTNVVSRNDTWIADAASTINWQGRSATFFTNYVYSGRRWILSSGVYADERVANGSPIDSRNGSLGNEYKDFLTGTRYSKRSDSSTGGWLPYQLSLSTVNTNAVVSLDWDLEILGANTNTMETGTWAETGNGWDDTTTGLYVYSTNAANTASITATLDTTTLRAGRRFTVVATATGAATIPATGSVTVSLGGTQIGTWVNGASSLTMTGVRTAGTAATVVITATTTNTDAIAITLTSVSVKPWASGDVLAEVNVPIATLDTYANGGNIRFTTWGTNANPSALGWYFHSDDVSVPRVITTYTATGPWHADVLITRGGADTQAGLTGTVWDANGVHPIGALISAAESLHDWDLDQAYIVFTGGSASAAADTTLYGYRAEVRR